MNADSAHSGSKLSRSETTIMASSSTLSLLHSHATATYPEECCGLLLGIFKEGPKTKQVQEAKPMSNVFERTERYHRYTIDPKQFMETEAEAELRGLEIVGIYHSHPNAPAKPSEFDKTRAWPSLSYMVMELREGQVMETKSWILKDDRTEFVPEEIVME